MSTWTASAEADLGGFVIRRFDVELAVQPNSDVLVEERIEVEFFEPRRGIYRTIPVRYTDPRGFGYSLGFRLLDVSDGAGRGPQVKVSDEGRETRIRIGDPDHQVTGTVLYVIRYRVRDALGRGAEHDEIYWNATGHEWNATIERASVVVRLPSNVAAASLRSAAYSGRFGSREQNVLVSTPEAGAVRFDMTQPLEPLEGLTVAVGFPKGLVQFPGLATRIWRMVLDNWVIVLPFAWFFMLMRWYRQKGRDPDAAAPVMVQYAPPDGLTPGGVGTLIDERVDIVDISATVVDLAVRRYLTIRAEKRDLLFGLMKRDETVFVRERKPDGDLAPHEQRVLAGLFESGNEVGTSDLKNAFYKHIPAIQSALYERLVERSYFDASPESVRNRWVGYGFLAAIGTAAFSLAWIMWRGGLFPPAIVLPIVVGVLTLVLFAAFAPSMPRRTEAGVRARQWALGFQEFAGRVESDRLERTAADRVQHPEPIQAFESLLPYAMALGVASSWAKKYEGIYADTAPGWYVGEHHGRGFSTQSFERTLSTAMSQANESMTASPRSSSGSGGGGSSGGGGGGGGGGSW